MLFIVLLENKLTQSLDRRTMDFQTNLAMKPCRVDELLVVGKRPLLI